jgi:hypothetical protein
MEILIKYENEIISGKWKGWLINRHVAMVKLQYENTVYTLGKQRAVTEG